MITLYRKKGRRYVPVSDAMVSMHYDDVMRVGTWRMTYCYTESGRRYEYDVRPDTAGFVAACMLARQAMEDAIRARAPATPRPESIPYTKKQRAIIERYRAEMAEAGGNLPYWWQHTSAYELSEAAIKAVREWKE